LEDNKKQITARIIDGVRLVERDHKVVTTIFYDPATAKEVEYILNGFDQVSYIRFGGYPDAERVLFILYPYYMEIPMQTQIQALRIKWNPQFYSIDHRDILGSLIGSGIKREKIGDIIIDQGIAYCFVSSELASFLSTNLKRVGKTPVTVDVISLDEVIIPDPKIKLIKTTVASPRLDSILGACFGISRTKAVLYIESSRVNVNWEPVQKPDFTLAPGDIISVRGLGRGKVREFGRASRKGRLFVVLEKFI